MARNKLIFAIIIVYCVRIKLSTATFLESKLPSFFVNPRWNPDKWFGIEFNQEMRWMNRNEFQHRFYWKVLLHIVFSLSSLYESSEPILLFNHASSEKFYVCFYPPWLKGKISMVYAQFSLSCPKLAFCDVIDESSTPVLTIKNGLFVAGTCSFSHCLLCKLLKNWAAK